MSQSHATASSFITMTAKRIPATDAPAGSRTAHANAVTMQHATTVLYFSAQLLMITAKSAEPMVHNANDMGALRRAIRMPVENVVNATTSAENWGSTIRDAAAASIAMSCPASMHGLLNV
jgi:hypothetical protein